MARRTADRSLRAALLSLRWEGFQTAAEIADRLERWAAGTVADRLRGLAREGRLWSVLEAGSSDGRVLQEATFKFAHVRTDTADMIIARGRLPVRRSWKPVRRIAA